MRFEVRCRGFNRTNPKEEKEKTSHGSEKKKKLILFFSSLVKREGKSKRP
jgi:hypothetical protein